MPDEPLLTLRELAAQLDLPESTVRYYRDAFLDFVPSVGTGRRRRYPPQATAVLRHIAAGYALGRARAEIAGGLQQDVPGTTGGVAVTPAQPAAPRSMEDVTNLDLLAAILDGEREQRDALWQMAKEIVRLTEVLERQDGVLTGIADQAGVIVAGERPLSLAAGAAAPPPAAPLPAAAPPAPAAAPPDQPAPARDPSDVAQLRAELEAERALVERLREAKLHIEHRAADAEAALAEQRTRRSSVIKRLLGGAEQ